MFFEGYKTLNVKEQTHISIVGNTLTVDNIPDDVTSVELFRGDAKLTDLEVTPAQVVTTAYSARYWRLTDFVYNSDYLEVTEARLYDKDQNVFTSSVQGSTGWTNASDLSNNSHANSGFVASSNTNAYLDWDLGSAKEVKFLRFHHWDSTARLLKSAKMQYSDDQVNFTDLPGWTFSDFTSGFTLTTKAWGPYIDINNGFTTVTPSSATIQVGATGTYQAIIKKNDYLLVETVPLDVTEISAPLLENPKFTSATTVDSDYDHTDGLLTPDGK